MHLELRIHSISLPWVEAAGQGELVHFPLVPCAFLHSNTHTHTHDWKYSIYCAPGEEPGPVLIIYIIVSPVSLTIASLLPPFS